MCVLLIALDFSKHQRTMPLDQRLRGAYSTSVSCCKHTRSTARSRAVGIKAHSISISEPCINGPRASSPLTGMRAYPTNGHIPVTLMQLVCMTFGPLAAGFSGPSFSGHVTSCLIAWHEKKASPGTLPLTRYRCPRCWPNVCILPVAADGAKRLGVKPVLCGVCCAV